SDTKFTSHCGWPSFYAPLAEDRVRYIRDTSMGMERIEVRCANCDSHMGHVFEGEGYDTPTDQRYCINSISLKLNTADAQGWGAHRTERADLLRTSGGGAVRHHAAAVAGLRPRAELPVPRSRRRRHPARDVACVPSAAATGDGRHPWGRVRSRS